MRSASCYLVLAGLLGLMGCGSEDYGEKFGDEGTLYQDRESLLSLNIEDRTDAISLEDAESIKTEVPTLDEQVSGARGTARSSEASLLAQFVMYPGHTISSRVLQADLVFSRDECLQRCIDNPRCGAITLVEGVPICYVHGPTQSVDKLAPVPVQTKKGAITFDTYVIASRNQDYNEDGNAYINPDGSGAYRFKVLYADGTASTWKSPGQALVNTKIPYKAPEGLILSATGGSGLEFELIDFYVLKCYGDCSYPDFQYPFVSWYISDYFYSGERYRVSTDCDDSVADGCASNIGMGTSIPNQDPPYNEYMTFSHDGEPLSLKQLATDTQKFVW